MQQPSEPAPAPIPPAHMLMTLDHLVSISQEGYVASGDLARIDAALPGRHGLSSSSVVEHALDLGLLSEAFAPNGSMEVRVNAPALQLLGLDADRVYGNWEAEMGFVRHLFRVSESHHYNRHARRQGRLWRAATSVMVFLETGLDIWWLHDLAARPIADPNRIHDSEMYWQVENDIGVAIADEAGMLAKPTVDADYMLDFWVTEAGRAWLNGDGRLIADSVRAIELKGIA